MTFHLWILLVNEKPCDQSSWHLDCNFLSTQALVQAYTSDCFFSLAYTNNEILIHKDLKNYLRYPKFELWWGSGQLQEISCAYTYTYYDITKLAVLDQCRSCVYVSVYKNVAEKLCTTAASAISVHRVLVSQKFVLYSGINCPLCPYPLLSPGTLAHENKVNSPFSQIAICWSPRDQRNVFDE